MGINIVLPKYSIILPVGISFYTFQAVSYAVDVYRTNIKPERHFGKFALYISFFPQLVAGPIERADELLPQINKPKKNIDSNDFFEGIQLIIWGLFLKVVVADNLAYLIDAKFSSVNYERGGGLLFAIFLFTFQLYSDFNGYSKIAMGIAKLLGFRLMNNFNYPYVSSSFSEFWKRWHISLSQWIRDYIYIPLGGSHFTTSRTVICLLIAFVLSGLWHGATFNFVLWGTICGTLYILEVLLKKYLFCKISWWDKIKLLRIITVFSLFSLSLVPFRASSFQDTITIYQRILDTTPFDVYFWFAENRYSPGMIGLYVLILYEIWFGLELGKKLNFKNKVVKIAFYVTLFFMIILLGNDSGSQFIYFQF